MDPLVTFIIPTVGRRSLNATLESLYAQSDDDWAAVIVGDGVDPMDYIVSPIGWDVTPVQGPRQRSAGLTRNDGIEMLHVYGRPGDWIAFVDDDDVLESAYVWHLREQSVRFPDADVIVSRMDHPMYGILPDPSNPQIAHGRVGISYAVKRSVLPEDPFIREDLSRPGDDGNEDINLLLRLRDLGAVIHVSPFVDYIVRPNDPGRYR